MALQAPYALGPIRQGGQVLFVVRGADPYVYVRWVLTGNGTITPVNNYSNAYGVAMALWDSTGATAGNSIVVTTSVKS